MFFASCNMVLFLDPMPIESEIVNELPEVFLGDYLVVGYSNNRVEGDFKTISQISDNRYLIKTQKLTYIDSVHLINQCILPIQSVTFDGVNLYINTYDSTYIKGLYDTLTRESMRIEYEFNFKEGYYYNEFYENERDEDSKKKCQMLANKGYYYLNMEKFGKYWMTSRLLHDKSELSINSMNFSLDDEDETHFNQLVQKYNLKLISFEQPNSLDWRYYLVKSEDKLMANLYKERIFSSTKWYKIKNQERNWAVVPVLIFLVTILLIYFSIVRKMTTEKKR